jgi:hypothetical protein
MKQVSSKKVRSFKATSKKNNPSLSKASAKSGINQDISLIT